MTTPSTRIVNRIPLRTKTRPDTTQYRTCLTAGDLAQARTALRRRTDVTWIGAPVKMREITHPDGSITYEPIGG